MLSSRLPLCCPNCNKQYTRQACYDKHKLLCCNNISLDICMCMLTDVHVSMHAHIRTGAPEAGEALHGVHACLLHSMHACMHTYRCSWSGRSST